jgi:hypothetical protein
MGENPIVLKPVVGCCISCLMVAFLLFYWGWDLGPIYANLAYLAVLGSILALFKFFWTSW